MNEEDVNKEIYANLKYKIAPDEQDRAFEAGLQSRRKDYFGKVGRATESPLSPNRTGRTILLKTYLQWACGIAAVLLIGLFIWAPWNADLYEQYVISRSVSVAERSDAGADVVAQAAEQYNKGDFAAAKPLFEKGYAAAPGDAMIAYYYAITLIETEEEDKGRAILAELYKGESVFKYESAFYMALSYVKQNQKQEAMEWLERIPAETTHFEAAKELKQKLK